MLKRFHKAEQGNVAIVFALSLVPMTAFAGRPRSTTLELVRFETSCRRQLMRQLLEPPYRRTSARTSSAPRSPRLCSRQMASVASCRRCHHGRGKGCRHRRSDGEDDHDEPDASPANRGRNPVRRGAGPTWTAGLRPGPEQDGQRRRSASAAPQISKPWAAPCTATREARRASPSQAWRQWLRGALQCWRCQHKHDTDAGAADQLSRNSRTRSGTSSRQSQRDALTPITFRFSQTSRRRSHRAFIAAACPSKAAPPSRRASYVIKGPLIINSQAAVTGTGVTFYLTGSQAGFTINCWRSAQP